MYNHRRYVIRLKSDHDIFIKTNHYKRGHTFKAVSLSKERDSMIGDLEDFVDIWTDEHCARNEPHKLISDTVQHYLDDVSDDPHSANNHKYVVNGCDAPLEFDADDWQVVELITELRVV